MGENQIDENRIGRKALDQNRLDETWAHDTDIHVRAYENFSIRMLNNVCKVHTLGVWMRAKLVH